MIEVELVPDELRAVVSIITLHLVPIAKVPGHKALVCYRPGRRRKNGRQDIS